MSAGFGVLTMAVVGSAYCVWKTWRACQRDRALEAARPRPTVEPRSHLTILHSVPESEWAEVYDYLRDRAE